MTISYFNIDESWDKVPSEVAQRSKEAAIDIATTLGQTAFFPQGNELFLDDDTLSFNLGHKYVQTLVDNGIQVISSLSTVSAHGKRHWYLRLSESLEEMEKVVIQMALGSDMTKELLTMLRIRQGGTGSIALFETPTQALRVAKWRDGM